jgi:hypothetical protein
MAEFDSIVGGLFGASPQTLNLAREQQALDFANRVATAEGQRPGLGSVLGANVMGARGIRELGGVFGVEDPLMQRVSQQQQLLSGVDFTDLNSLTKGAQQATAAGRPDIADALAKKALEIRTKIEERQLNRDTQLQIAAERNQTRLEEARQRGADQKEIARIRAEGQQDLLNLRREVAEEKKQEKSEKQQQAADMAIGAADRVINEVKQARDKVSGFTAGAGALLSFVPLTEAKDLSKRLTTIKANLGFDRLQQMRDASPTGGALGQVAVQELIALQSTIASLDQDQSPAQLKEALDKIEFHYSNWRDTVRKSGKATPTAAAPEAGSKEVDFNSLPQRNKNK